MSKLLTPVNLCVAATAVITAIVWAIFDQNKTEKAEQRDFRDAFSKIIAIDENKTGVVCQDCWLHELNRDLTVLVDIKRYIVDIPRLDDIDLTGSDLFGSYFTKAIAINGTFAGAILDMALLDQADFSNADFSRANMRGANMTNVNLTGANLSGADLSPMQDTSWLRIFRGKFEEHGGQTNFGGAILKGVDFTDANLTGVKMKAAKDTDSAIFCNTIMPDGNISNRNCK
ncbi:MAG TPA: pentapeptide repeat-containing protein [Sneathiellales bacterium]|nr:pentapeptide repeat-containing protein [Sneathiellales bacterium]